MKSMNLKAIAVLILIAIFVSIALTLPALAQIVFGLILAAVGAYTWSNQNGTRNTGTSTL